jgi:ribosomal protein L11 methyltransferase
MSEPEAPSYPYVHLTVAAEDADAWSSALFDLGATGVEERDESTYVKGPGGGRVLLVASFDSREDADQAIAEIEERRPSAGEQRIEVKLHEVVGDAWRDAWKEFYEPFALTPNVIVRPPWKAIEGPVPGAAEGARVLELEPGRAFGTGLHATTSLVANILDDSRAELAGHTVLDAGCGSGILSFTAIALGAAKAIAFDIDEEVVATVVENAERNGMTDRVTIRATTVDTIGGTFLWVLANIESRILDPIAEDLIARVAPGGHLVLSGILTAEEGWMRDRFTKLSRPFEVVATRHMTTGGDRAYDKDGWVALHLVARG